MYLKRLELRGFKTFATDTHFVFDEGITAIVGPNGSGKSNVADAVRWVLGEQSYSLLRGKRTEDMIFAGTHRRTQMGMAEAVMVFDNSSGWLPIDFGEVSLGRRAYRSGENRYSINESRVRLRDVSEFVGRAGLGTQGLVTIGQGVADAALSLRPEERRTLFEEAAGIRVYQDKRSEALRRLAETHQNLLRLRDIVTEIGPRLRLLERQARRAEEHQLLTQDLEKLLRVWYGYRWRRLQARFAEAESALLRRIADVEMGRGRLHEIEALAADTQAHQGELRRQLSVWHSQSSTLHTQAEEIGRELAVANERRSLLQQRGDELRIELAALQDRCTATLSALSVVQEDSSHLEEEVLGLQSHLGERRSSWEKADRDRAAAERAVETEREKAYELATAEAAARNRCTQAEERRRRVAAEREKAESELAEAEDRLPDLDRDMARAQQQADDLLRAREEAAARQRNLRDKLTELDRRVQQSHKAHAEALRQTQRVQDRMDMLQGLRQSLAGYAPGTKAILEAKSKLPGIVGPVIQLLRVPAKLDRAIEAALGGYTQALVVESWEQAGVAIADLRKRSAGWATFIPLDTVKAPPSKPAPTGKGVLGLAHELIEYEPRFDEIARLLLGRTVLAQDLQAAKRIRSKLKPGQTVVTLDGEVVQASGVISGGSPRKGVGLLAQEREWRELPARLAASQGDLQAAQSASEQLEGEQEEQHRQLAAATENAGRLQSESETLERRSSELRAENERLRQEIEWRSSLAKQQQAEWSALGDKLDALQQELEERTHDHDQGKASLQAAIESLEEARQAEERTRQVLSESETSLAAAERQRKVQQELLATQEAERDRLEAELGAKTERAKEIESESLALQQRLVERRTTADSLSEQIAAVAAQIQPAEAEVVNLQRQVSSLERELALARQRLGELEQLHSQQVLAKERRHDELQALELLIEQELGGIEYPSERARQLRLDFFRRERHVLPATEDLPENLQADIKDLKGRLRRLGGVNPNAPQEYAEVRERHEFLDLQITDLVESSASLHEVIKELDEVMQREFLAVFDIAEKEFSRYFKLLFGGGQARLILTDPDKPSETGVDIVARPPGKRLQSLALLSGGERALTATALLFAVLKARPLPFCVLDEVDAMLDEANVGRFRALLEEFAQQTQFIVITHNRRTVEAARTIYGVTMAENGVSQVVSLRLEGEEVPR